MAFITDDPDTLKLTEVFDLATRLMKEFGLLELGWKFELINARNTVGSCSHHKKVITYSKKYLHTPMDEIEDTIRHEIAHALVGRGHGHDYYWKAKAREVGARPERCAPPDVKPIAEQHNYEIVCTGCGKKWKRYRLRKNLMAPHVRSGCCHAPLKFYKYTKGG